MNSTGETQLDTIEGNMLDEKGVSVTKKYSKGKFLGKGGFAKCYEFKDLETGKILAAKIIDKLSLAKEKSKQKLASEINIHKSLNHHGVVRFENNFEDSRNVYILLELCPNQTLKELVKRRKRLTELEAQCYLGQLIPTLIYLHNSNIIHRDLKLGNLFLAKNMELKIGDFGLAAKLATPFERRKTVCGTPNYIAPEILNSKRGTGLAGHSFEVDIWAVGIILYTMLIGKPPFEASNVKLTYKKIRANEYTVPPEVQISTEALSLINRILVATPEKRPKLEEIMCDPFMTKNPYPKTLPLMTLSSIPTNLYMSQFIKIMERDYTPRGVFSGSNFDIKTPARSESGFNASGNFKPKADLLISCDIFKRTPHNTTTKKIPTDLTVKNDTKSTRPVTSAANSPVTATLLDPFSPVFVDFYADYTDRYGVGYILSNGVMGFFFNDLSNVLLLHYKNQYAYSDMYDTNGGRISSETIPKKYKLLDYPKEIEKKVKILNHFKQWYENSKKDVQLRSDPGVIPTDSEESICVKKVIKTNSGLMFRLSNHIIQMNFTDKSQLIVSFRAKMMVYFNKKGEKSIYKLSNQLFQSANDSIIQRFRYVRHIVNTMNSVHTKGHSPIGKSKGNRINGHK